MPKGTPGVKHCSRAHRSRALFLAMAPVTSDTSRSPERIPRARGFSDTGFESSKSARGGRRGESPDGSRESAAAWRRALHGPMPTRQQLFLGRLAKQFDKPFVAARQLGEVR